MNPRYQPGGDKYESIKSDAQYEWAAMIKAEQEDILSTLKSVVSTWTENEIEAGNEPIFERFIDAHPEWDYDTLIATISEEMERVKKLCGYETKVYISN